MSEHRPALEHIQAYADHLRLEEKKRRHRREKYLRDVRAFARWLEGGRSPRSGRRRGRPIWWSGATPPPASMPCSPP